MTVKPASRRRLSREWSAWSRGFVGIVVAVTSPGGSKVVDGPMAVEEDPAVCLSSGSAMSMI